uniref:Uncharacterized protein n=2 Tax=Strongyloides stercoralis TaxID=6248 RepID=A0A0K0E821_STRER
MYCIHDIQTLNMPLLNKRKALETVNTDSSFPKMLRAVQEKNGKEIKKKEDELKEIVIGSICEGTEIVYNAVIVNLPSELLEMKYSEFLKQMSGLSFNADKHNDTLTAIENLRSRVVSGIASPGEVSRYRELKKLI